MNLKRLQIFSMLFLFLFLVIEISELIPLLGFLEGDISMGLSLAFVLASMSINIKIIRTMGIDKKVRQQSQGLMFVAAVFVLMAYGFDLF